MNENMEFPGISGEEIQWLQDSFVQTIFARLEVCAEYIGINLLARALKLLYILNIFLINLINRVFYFFSGNERKQKHS